MSDDDRIFGWNSTLSQNPKKRLTSNRARRAKEFVRCYGSEERVETIKAMPCTVPGCKRGPSDNAHTENGGMGRKADWDTIVPLCRAHHYQLDDGLGSPVPV